ncbi:hypothetical protein M0R19_07560 [Candidatus Pacearchaeota archaeon]|nr:hypothetical protein [Candidatus Pacearchaeota archaeon]
MPIQEKKIKDFIEDLQVKHYNDILNGKIEIWISPFIKEKKSNFFQLILDIDTKKSSNSKIYSYFLVLKSMNIFKKYFTILYSGNGYHITSNFFVDFKENSDMEVKEFLKNNLKKNIPGLDLIIIRDNPVRRIGYRKDINKWCSPAEDKLLPPESKRLPSLKEIDLKSFIEYKLLPWKKVITVSEFKNILNMSQLGG